jgi:peptidoglycan/xylan/chitin deacetylase (PgdA/CDA1 family)
MPSRVLFTVDTELTSGHFGRGLGWEEALARSYDPAGVGIPYQLRVLADHGLKACFFVDPMPALLYGLDPVRRMVQPILAAGQEVQLHLHSFWLSVSQGAKPANYELTGFDPGQQLDLIRTARDLLVEAGAPEPIAFRSGSYAADAATLAALRSLGIRYDSSHNGAHHPWPSALPLDPWLIAPVEIDGVVEIPVTLLEDRRGSIRHLQLTAVSFEELRAALRHAADRRHPIVNIVSHSFELASRDGLRANRSLCRRFERLCGFLGDSRAALPTAHFTDLADLPLGEEATPLSPHLLRTASRMAQQALANLVYERRL